MNETKSSESESDLSTNSSWTILDDKQDSKCNLDQENESDSLSKSSLTELNTNAIVIGNYNGTSENEREVFGSSTVINRGLSDKVREDSFLTFDEYLHEHIIECDYENPAGSSHSLTALEDNKQKDRKRCKAETMQILSMTCSLLVLTGLSLLCILFPHKIHENVVRTIDDDFFNSVNTDQCDLGKTVSALNKTEEMIKMVAESQLLGKIKDDLSERYSNVGPQTWEEFSDKNNNMKSGSFVQNDIHVLDKKIDKLHENLSMNEKADDPEKPYSEQHVVPASSSRQRSKLSAFKEFLSKTNILTILSCVMHNVCVFKLVKHLCRKQSNKEVKPTEELPQNITMIEPEAKPPQEVKPKRTASPKRKLKLLKMHKKCSSRDSSLKQNKISSARVPEILPNTEIRRDLFTWNLTPKPFSISPVKSRKLIEEISPEQSRALLNVTHNTSNREWKPHDELVNYRKKSEIFTEQHRKKIKFLKNEFHQEIAEVKKKEIESGARSSRISAIKENFIRRLKQHREKYLNDLKILKEERQLLLKELCSNKQPQTVNCKDAAVGNYVVPLTGLCAFEEKLKLLQEKQTNNKPIVKKSFPALPSFNTESSEDKLGPYQSSPCFNVEKLKLEKIIPFRQNLNKDNGQGKPEFIDSVDEQHQKLTEIRKKYLKKQTEILDEYSRLMSDEVCRMESSNDKIVDPCISLLDEIILEAVDMVHKRNDTMHPTRIVIEKRLITKKDDSRQKRISSELDRIGKSSGAEKNYHDAVCRNTETARSLMKKMDLYSALFDKQARNIKMLENRKPKEDIPEIQNQKHLSKQDPQKCYVEKIMRGHY